MAKEAPMIRTTSLLCVTGLLLSACGSTTEERGISGAGIGAAAGTIVGAVTGLTLVQGALIGAAAGGITGVATDKSQVNLGDPIWKRGSSSSSNSSSASSSKHASAGNGTVRDIQSKLAQQGFDPGPTDGRLGPKTRSAITQYQQKNNLLVDGNASPELLAHMQRS
jgi:peptidoglycan hydrolase-like protein with peptidoglycan-binding domain